MPIKTTNERRMYSDSGKRLRVLRRRYIRAVAPYITADHSLLWSCAEKAHSRGLYAQATTLEHIRFTILRSMCKMNGKKQRDWREWLLREGWGQRGWNAAA